LGEKSHQGLVVAFVLVLTLAVLPPPATAQGAAAGPPCLAYAFTQSGDYDFLATNDHVVHGDNLTIIHNCQRLEAFVDDVYVGGTNSSSFRVPVSPGMVNLSLIDVEGNQIWNLTFEVIPDRLKWDIQWEQLQLSLPSYVDGAEVSRQANWAAAMTGLIVWVLSVYVYWNLINSFVQRNYVEEVVA
jgi:hypothetical protein